MDASSLRIAGGLLVAAGVLQFVAFFAGGSAVIPIVLLQQLLIAGAFLFFVRAGYPSRSQGPRTVAYILMVLYVLSGLVTVGLTAGVLPVETYYLLIVTSLGVFVMGIVFGALVVRTPGVPVGLRWLPLGMYVALAALGITDQYVGAASIGTGIVYAAAGVLFLVFATRPASRTAEARSR